MQNWVEFAVALALFYASRRREHPTGEVPEDDPLLGPGMAWARAHELLEPADRGRVRLTPRGRLLSNEVFRRLLP